MGLRFQGAVSILAASSRHGGRGQKLGGMEAGAEAGRHGGRGRSWEAALSTTSSEQREQAERANWEQGKAMQSKARTFGTRPTQNQGFEYQIL